MTLGMLPIDPIPFIRLLGFELLRFDGGCAEVALELREELGNAWGVAHGGVLMTLLDTAMAHAARSPDEPGGPTRPGVVTVEMKTSFVRPGQGRLRAQGRVLHRSASLTFCEGSVIDAGGQLVSHGTGTFKSLRGLPVDGRRVQRHGASD